jgi:hypothetical protein
VTPSPTPSPSPSPTPRPTTRAPTPRPSPDPTPSPPTPAPTPSPRAPDPTPAPAAPAPTAEANALRGAVAFWNFGPLPGDGSASDVVAYALHAFWGAAGKSELDVEAPTIDGAGLRFEFEVAAPTAAAKADIEDRLAELLEDPALFDPYVRAASAGTASEPTFSAATTDSYEALAVEAADDDDASTRGHRFWKYEKYAALGAVVVSSPWAAASSPASAARPATRRPAATAPRAPRSTRSSRASTRPARSPRASSTTTRSKERYDWSDAYLEASLNAI